MNTVLLLIGVIFSVVSLGLSQSSTDRIGPVEVRLVGGTSAADGRLEVRQSHGLWGTVCDDFWDEKETTVVCRQLGYGGGEWRVYAGEQSTGPIHLDDVLCTGTEQNLSECLARPWSVKNCDHDEDVALSCFNMKARLLNGSLVELAKEGTNSWGTLCYAEREHNFDLAAKVICKMLSWTDGQVLDIDFPTSEKRILRVNSCTGSEKTIQQCKTSKWGFILGCTQDLHVHCHNGDNPLPPGHPPQFTSGAVLTKKHNSGEFGIVCDNIFDHKAASVACRGMGFKYGKALGYSVFGNSIKNSYAYAISQLRCAGFESSLSQCNNLQYGTACLTGYYGSMFCASKDIPSLIHFKVPKRAFYMDGELSAYIHVLNGKMCPTEDWDDKTATIICKQLDRLSVGVAYRLYKDTTYRRSPGWNSFFPALKCSGSETVPEKCLGLRDSNKYISPCQDVFTAAALCFRVHDDKTSPVTYRIESKIETTTEVSGFPQITFKSYNYTRAQKFICDPATIWRDEEATVFCRSLGYKNGTGSTRMRYYNYQFNSDYLLINVDCSGREKSIINCAHHPLLEFNQYCPTYKDSLGRFGTRTVYVKCFKNVDVTTSTKSSATTTAKSSTTIASTSSTIPTTSLITSTTTLTTSTTASTTSTTSSTTSATPSTTSTTPSVTTSTILSSKPPSLISTIPVSSVSTKANILIGPTDPKSQEGAEEGGLPQSTIIATVVAICLTLLFVLIGGILFYKFRRPHRDVQTGLEADYAGGINNPAYYKDQPHYEEPDFNPYDTLPDGATAEEVYDDPDVDDFHTDEDDYIKPGRVDVTVDDTGQYENAAMFLDGRRVQSILNPYVSMGGKKQ